MIAVESAVAPARSWKIGMGTCVLAALLTVPLAGSGWPVVAGMATTAFWLSVAGLAVCSVGAWLARGARERAPAPEIDRERAGDADVQPYDYYFACLDHGETHRVVG